jgi:hypothetical protein
VQAVRGRTFDFTSGVSAVHPPVTPSLVPRPGAASGASTNLWILGLLVFVTHLALLAAIQWMVFDQFLSRSLVDVRQPLTTAFVGHGIRVVSVELLILGAARLAILALHRVRRSRVDMRRLAAAGLLSYAPLVLYSTGVIVAFLAGWELDVWLLSASEASAREIASTIREALPVVLAPLLTGRQVANIVGTALFAWLQHRLCRTGTMEAVLTAALAGAIVMAGYAFAWSA